MAHDGTGGWRRPPSTSAAANAGQAERGQLRTQMRARRRLLSKAQSTAAAAQFARVMQRARLLRPGRRIAVYLAYDHEADPRFITRLARRRGCRLYLPAITDYRRARMEFLPYPATATLRANRYRIAEPQRRGAAPIAVRSLDLIILPLVAVDEHGTRLGSGAGFYDRCLQRLRYGRRWRRPKLLGLGYEFQRVPHLARQAWDVPLDALLTEKALHYLRSPT
jgi:5-formyltetrahydrofolate cyclo-ligase